MSSLLQDMLADLACSASEPAARVDHAVAIIDAEAVHAALLDLNFDGQISYQLRQRRSLSRSRLPALLCFCATEETRE